MSGKNFGELPPNDSENAPESDLTEKEQSGTIDDESARKETADEMIKKSVETGSAQDAKELAELRDKDLSQEEIQQLVDKCIKKGDLDNLEKAIELREEGLTEKEFSDLTKVCYEENLGRVLEMVLRLKQGKDKKETLKIISEIDNQVSNDEEVENIRKERSVGKSADEWDRVYKKRIEMIEIKKLEALEKETSKQEVDRIKEQLAEAKAKEVEERKEAEAEKAKVKARAEAKAEAKKVEVEKTKATKPEKKKRFNLFGRK